MERMVFQCGRAARDAGCFMASAIGFDCMPAEIGADAALRLMADRSLIPHSVHSYLSFDWGPNGAAANYGT
jgi:short subunit dehydrogenase-like uncharacterized protein